MQSEGEWANFVEAVSRANYSWVLISLVVALLSHVSRAYRWKYTLEPLGYKPDFKNSFYSVMIGYLINLAIPRLGEVSRCGFMSRYEKIPIEKLLGTVIAERVADLIMLGGITTAVIFLQFNQIESLLLEITNADDGSSNGNWAFILLGIAVLGLAVMVYLYRLNSEHKLIVLYQKILNGIFEGVKSIFTMKQKWAFIAHTLFIWGAYFLMFYLCFFSLPEAADVPIGGVFTGFVLGGIAIALTNGGIGAYPIAIQLILGLYGIASDVGGALGWIIWTAQTVLIIVVGLLSLFLIQRNRKTGNEPTPANQS